MSKTKWFPYGANTNSKCKIQVFCFYFAGGSSSVFKQWVGASKEIAFIPVELPGRGMRIGEPGMERIEEVVGDIIPMIYEVARPPFSFFGHSMGAMIAFQTAWQLHSHHMLIPEMLIVAGRHAPHRPDPSRLNSKMNDDELINELKRLNGTPGEILDNPEMIRFLIPIIRSDLKLHESFKYTGQTLQIPIYAHCGHLDYEADKKIMGYWKEVTDGPFQIEEFQGDHFFVQSLGELYVNNLITTLSRKTYEEQIPY